MSTDIRIFDFEDNAVRTLFGEDGEILFHGADVCKCLGYHNVHQAMKTHLSDDDLQKLEAVDTKGRKNSANFINEAGLYSLIFGSTKGEAVRFKYWVTHDVLPQIRKTGQYQPDNALNHDVIPDESHEIGFDADIVTHLSLIRETRMTWGRAAARNLWKKLPLPRPFGSDEDLEESHSLSCDDGTKHFLETLVKDENARISAAHLYKAYCDFKKDRGERPLRQRSFGRFAGQIFNRVKSGNFYYVGCGLPE